MEIQDNSGFLVDTQMRLDKSLTKDCDTDHDQTNGHQEQEFNSYGNCTILRIPKIDIY